MLHVLITNDYEVSGDGRGDPRRMLVPPTAEALAVCAAHGVPQTLFVDVLEVQAFERAEAEGLLGPAYDAASAIKAQLRDAVRDGHDCQLHLHPQWLGAAPVAEDRWTVDERWWRTARVPGGLGDAAAPAGDSLHGLLRGGRRWLEDLLTPIDAAYRCLAFRAGGYCIQPEAEVLEALREAGFRVDSSVTLGRHLDDGRTYFDYRAAPADRPWWPIGDSVTRPDPAGRLVEAPLFTGRLRPLLRRRRPARGTLPMPPAEPGGRAAPPSFMRRLRCALAAQPANIDFCKLTTDEMIAFTTAALRRHRRALAEGAAVPLVVIGHSKEWGGGRELDGYLAWLGRRPEVVFDTFAGWLSTATGEEAPGLRRRAA